MSKIIAEQEPAAVAATWAQRVLGTFEERLSSLERSTWHQRAMALIAAMTAFRLLIISTTGLTDTETYYLSWTRVLDWSYYDHPPLVAWSARLWTLASHSAFAVRMGPVVYAGIAGVLLVRLGTRLFSPRAGFFALLVVTVLPGAFFTSFVLNPEGLLAPLWLWILLSLDGLRRGREAWRPLVLGLAIGTAFLAKYTAVLAVPIALVFVATTPSLRHWLRRPSFYGAGLLALALTSPVLYWNSAHHWPSVSLHLSERMPPMTGATWLVHARQLVVGQLVVFHPLVLPALLATVVPTIRRARTDERYRLLAWAGAPVLAFFYAVMIRVCDAESHWTLVGYMALALALGAFLDESFDRLPERRTRVLRWAMHGVAALSFAAFGVYFIHSQTLVLARFLSPPIYDLRADPVTETMGWDRVQRAITSEAKIAGPNTVVVSVHNVLCGHAAVALGDQPPVYCASPRRTEFDFVGRRSPPPDAPVLYLESGRYAADPAAALPGRRCRLAQNIDVTHDGSTVSEFRIFACAPLGT
ncbi:MAG TPA: glycosyltransferase family 39 protein [Polyangiaceae bacterium]|jgi:4-amino-4-deoxy-L-arabinose transferase-like glycosyltransferase|nr:glycosyltransferase family 39 protein [Polyangiaceae bacterium]